MRTRPTMFDSFRLLALCHYYYSVSPLHRSSHIVLLKHMTLCLHQSMAEQQDRLGSNLIEKHGIVVERVISKLLYTNIKDT